MYAISLTCVFVSMYVYYTFCMAHEEIQVSFAGIQGSFVGIWAYALGLSCEQLARICNYHVQIPGFVSKGYTRSSKLYQAAYYE